MTSLLLNIDENNNNNTKAQFGKYWCHLCQKDFSQILDETTDIQCIFCGKTFCELIPTNNPEGTSHPRNFKPYIANINNNTNNSNNSNNSENDNENDSESISNLLLDLINGANGTDSQSSSFLSTQFIASNLHIYNFGFFSLENNLDNIMNTLMMMDNNKYGNPPAAKNAIEKLKKIKLSKDKINELLNEKNKFCAVCKDEFNTEEECLIMPCDHFFHEGCLIPWLKLRNSCPVCRFELPTDDEDFEMMKREKNINNIGNNNNLNENGN